MPSWIILLDTNELNIWKYKHGYKRRQAIVEHPYGTIKRQWGLNYIITKKGKDRASADVGFMFIAYNLVRIINIIGQDAFKKYMEVLVFIFSLILLRIKRIVSYFNEPKFFRNFNLIYFAPRLNRLIFDKTFDKGGGY